MKDNTALFAYDEKARAASPILCGVDEAGRGPLAGPVCCAAVILPADFYHPLLNDSKKVSEKNRDILYEKIISQAVA